jgi:hypothetical protein
MTFGVRLAVIGLAIQAVLNTVLFVRAGEFERNAASSIVALLVGIAFVALLAWGITRRSRLAFVVTIGIAAIQTAAWFGFMAMDPVFTLWAPIGWILTIVGLVLSWREAWTAAG